MGLSEAVSELVESTRMDERMNEKKRTANRKDSKEDCVLCGLFKEPCAKHKFRAWVDAIDDEDSVRLHLYFSKADESLIQAFERIVVNAKRGNGREG